MTPAHGGRAAHRQRAARRPHARPQRPLPRRHARRRRLSRRPRRAGPRRPRRPAPRPALSARPAPRACWWPRAAWARRTTTSPPRPSPRSPGTSSRATPKRCAWSPRRRAGWRDGAVSPSTSCCPRWPARRSCREAAGRSLRPAWRPGFAAAPRRDRHRRAAGRALGARSDVARRAARPGRRSRRGARAPPRGAHLRLGRGAGRGPARRRRDRPPASSPSPRPTARSRSPPATTPADPAAAAQADALAAALARRARSSRATGAPSTSSSPTCCAAGARPSPSPSRAPAACSAARLTELPGSSDYVARRRHRLRRRRQARAPRRARRPAGRARARSPSRWRTPWPRACASVSGPTYGAQRDRHRRAGRRHARQAGRPGLHRLRRVRAARSCAGTSSPATGPRSGPGASSRALHLLRRALLADASGAATRSFGRDVSAARSEPSRRLFVACDLPGDVGRGGRPLAGRRAARPRATCASLHTLHLTLCFLGAVADSRARRHQRGARRARAAGLADGLRGAAVPAGARRQARGRAASRRPPRSARRDPAGGLRRLARLGVYTPERRPWLPHLTVARYRRPGHPFSLQNVNIGAFGLPSVILYASLLERAGAVHTPLASFPAKS